MKQLLFAVLAFFIFILCGCDKNFFKNPDTEPPSQMYKVPDSIALKINNYFSSFSYPGFGTFSRSTRLIVPNPMGFTTWPNTSLDLHYPINSFMEEATQLKVDSVKDKIMQELFPNYLYGTWHCTDLAISVKFNNASQDKVYFYKLL